MIKRILAVGIACSLTFLSLADQVAPTGQVRYHVKVRNEPRSQGAEVGRLSVGQTAELVGDAPRWHEIELESGTTGFVPKSRTRVIPIIEDKDEDDLRVHFLNVGAGSCAVVECPGPNAPPLIVDCGSMGPTDNGLNKAGAAHYMQGILDQHDVRPNLVLSHADRDHYGWISEVLDGVQMQNIWQGGDSDDYDQDGFPDWIQEQDAGGADIHDDLERGFHNDEFALSDDELDCGDASVFALTANVGSSKNANSLVIEVRHDDFGIVFTGDAEGSTERSARENYADVTTTVLSGSHHGADTKGSNGSRWAEATDPKVMVFSAGRRFGHPQCDAVEQFEPFVEAAARHPTQCGEGSTYEPVRNTRNAIYMTEVNGLVIVTSNGTSPLSLFCNGSSGCDAEIEH